jgi:hypothetical protein
MNQSIVPEPAKYFESGRRYILQHCLLGVAIHWPLWALFTGEWLGMGLAAAVEVAAIWRSQRIALVIDAEKSVLVLRRWRRTHVVPFASVVCYRFGKTYAGGPQRIAFVLDDGRQLASYGFCIDDLFDYLSAAKKQQVMDLLAPLRSCPKDPSRATMAL